MFCPYKFPASVTPTQRSQINTSPAVGFSGALLMPPDSFLGCPHVLRLQGISSAAHSTINSI